MTIHLRPATLEDVSFLADVVITATIAQGRFPQDEDRDKYRAGYEDWTRETILGAIPDCTLSVIERDGHPMGRLRVVRTQTRITLAGIQLVRPDQKQGIGKRPVPRAGCRGAKHQMPLHISVEKDNPHARRLYERLGCRLIGEDENEYQLEYLPVIGQGLGAH